MMSEASSTPRWRLSVWSESSDRITTFEFDAEPDYSVGQVVATYNGEREGRAVRAFVAIEQVAAWSLEEMPR
jgi:hypothetical protein